MMHSSRTLLVLLRRYLNQEHDGGTDMEFVLNGKRRRVPEAHPQTSFCAAFLGTGQPFLPQPGQKCGLGMSFRHSATLAVEDELHIGPPVVLLVEIAAE